MLEYTSRMFRQMLAQCFASSKINKAEIKARHLYIATVNFFALMDLRICACNHDNMAHSTMQ